MRKLGLLVGAAALLLVFSVAWVEGQDAKDKAKAKTPPGGFGGGGFGGFGGGAQSPYTLFNRADVKKELDITDEQAAKLPAEVLVAIGRVLDEKQFKRFKQIDMQQRGNNAFKDKTIQKQLKMTDEQVKNISSLIDDSAKALGEIKGGGFGGGGKDATEKRDAIRKEAKEKILTVLTKDQRTAYRDMIGEDFKFQQQGFGGGGFGGFGKKKDEPKKDNE